MNLGPTELLIILIIVLILFGVGRISKIAGELGASIRAFREGLQGTGQDAGAEKPGNPESSDTPKTSYRIVAPPHNRSRPL